MMITRVNHPSHPEHELELKNHTKINDYTCDRCNKEGCGLRYRCDECNFDLHEDCVLNTQLVNSKDSLIKSTIQSDIAADITPTHHPSHPQHELKLEHYKKPYKCDGCKEQGFGSGYRCHECDFDLHEDCILNTRIINSKDSLIKSTIQSDIAAEITPTHHPSHPQHELKLKHYKKPYNCDGCKEQGFGSRYSCEDCNYDLHEDCMLNTRTASHDFFHGSTFKFFEKPSINGEIHKRYCDACGKIVNGFVYHCAEEDLDFHPCCRNLKNKILIDGVSLRLKDKVSSKCIWCKHKTLEGSSSGIRGWSYVSSCKKYHFHVYCVTQIVVEGWKNSDNDDDVSMALENMKLPLQRGSNSSGGRGRKYWKILQIFLKVAAILLGDPTVVLTSAAINLITNL